jgi:hypothetical protein
MKSTDGYADIVWHQSASQNNVVPQVAQKCYLSFRPSCPSRT